MRKRGFASPERGRRQGGAFTPSRRGNYGVEDVGMLPISMANLHAEDGQPIRPGRSQGFRREGRDHFHIRPTTKAKSRCNGPHSDVAVSVSSADVFRINVERVPVPKASLRPPDQCSDDQGQCHCMSDHRWVLSRKNPQPARKTRRYLHRMSARLLPARGGMNIEQYTRSEAPSSSTIAFRFRNP